MGKPKVVVRKFRCQGSGDDCPPFGYEVVQARHTKFAKEHDMLLDDGIEQLKNKKVKVVVV